MSRGGPRPNSGGARPGAGRPKKQLSAPDIQAAVAAGMTPLEYMLSVMRDPAVDGSRRDRMAISAAPYVHPRAIEATVGKKDKAQAAAETAGEGSDWGTDLAGPQTPSPLN
jgi:hypothetical protein